MDDDPQRKSRTYLDRGLYREILADQLLSGAVGILLGGFAQRPYEIAFAIAKSQFGANAKQRG